jgi:hypothetical protein
MRLEEPAPDEEPPFVEMLPEAEGLFLSRHAVPRRKNQMMAAGLAVIAVFVLAIVVTLTLLIRYDNLPSLFSYFS